jgi:hypothetical protein
MVVTAASDEMRRNGDAPSLKFFPLTSAEKAAFAAADSEAAAAAAAGTTALECHSKKKRAPSTGTEAPVIMGTDPSTCGTIPQPPTKLRKTD